MFTQTSLFGSACITFNTNPQLVMSVEGWEPKSIYFIRKEKQHCWCFHPVCTLFAVFHKTKWKLTCYTRISLSCYDWRMKLNLSAQKYLSTLKNCPYLYFGLQTSLPCSCPRKIFPWAVRPSPHKRPPLASSSFSSSPPFLSRSAHQTRCAGGAELMSAGGVVLKRDLRRFSTCGSRRTRNALWAGDLANWLQNPQREKESGQRSNWSCGTESVRMLGISQNFSLTAAAVVGE